MPQPPRPKMRRMISTTSILEPWEGWLCCCELLEDELDEELDDEDELLLDELEDELEEEGWPEEELCD